MSYKKLSEYLKSKRVASGLTQGELGKKLGGVHPQFVSNWERGTCGPPAKLFQELIKVLKLNRATLEQVMLLDSEVQIRDLVYCKGKKKHFAKKERLKEYTKAECIADARKYKRSSDWRRYSGLYYQARMSGWLDECLAHMPKKHRPSKAWSFEEVMTEAKKYGSPQEWRINSSKTYQAAHKLGCFEDCISHMEKPLRMWTKEMCMADAKKYAVNTDWLINSRPVYNLARRKGWYWECVKHMSRKNKSKWTDEEILNLARKYRSSSEWRQKDIITYNAAIRRGILKQCLKAMKPMPQWSWDLEKILEKAS